jgi:hypothetical protein
MCHFEKSILNYQTNVSKFLNVSLKDILLRFAVKSCQNSQNTQYFFTKKKKKKNGRI